MVEDVASPEELAERGLSLQPSAGPSLLTLGKRGKR
jgi:hypothetical protein